MKKSLCVFVLVPIFIFLLGSCSGVDSPPGAEDALPDPLLADYSIMIPDANLRAVIKDTLATSCSITKDWGEITQDDLRQITTLVAIAKSIAVIDGIGLCSNIQVLRLVGNSIEDITPVTSLTALVDCTFRDNNITTIAPLEDLPHPEILEFFGIMGNSVSCSDWSAVITPSKFPNLQGFSVSGTTDDGLTTLFTNGELATFLSNPPTGGFEDIQISRFPEIDDTAFATLFDTYIFANASSLLGMYIIDCSISNASLSKLATLSKLQYLILSGNTGVTDLANLASIIGTSGYTSLNVSRTMITGLASLQTAYDAGGFHQTDASINITNCGLSIIPASANRAVVDYLIGKGVRVDWEAGNTIIN